MQHFVYTSVNGTLPTWGIFLETRRAVEEYVKQRRMTYTILRPNYLMDLWLGPAVGFDIANARVQVFGSGEGKINWVALGDVLQFAVQALDHPAAHNATLELNGPDWLSLMDVIRLCEEIGGRSFAIQHVPEETLQEQEQIESICFKRQSARSQDAQGHECRRVYSKLTQRCDK